MSTLKKILFFFLFPIMAVLSFPPATLIGGLPIILVALVIFALLGWTVWRGRSSALTLLIFLMGMNVITRLMMFFPGSITVGQVNWPYIVTNLFGLALSFFLMLRLDRSDVRVQMVT